MKMVITCLITSAVIKALGVKTWSMVSGALCLNTTYLTALAGGYLKSAYFRPADRKPYPQLLL
jgi:hypothetical protein